MKAFYFSFASGVLFPGIAKPLQVVDPEAVELIRLAVSNQDFIALSPIEVAPSQDGSIWVPELKLSLKSVCGFGVPLILEEKPDGSLFVLVKAVGKLQVSEVSVKKKRFVELVGVPVEDNRDLGSSDHKIVTQLYSVLNGWISRQVPDETRRRQFMATITGFDEIVASLAAFMIKDLDLQQMILEETSQKERLRLLNSMLKSIDFQSA